MKTSVESVRLSVARRLSLSAAAKLVGVHVRTVWRWALHGVKGHILPTKLIGGRRFVLRADLEAFLDHDVTATEPQAEPQDVAPAVEAGAKLDQLLGGQQGSGK